MATLPANVTRQFSFTGFSTNNPGQQQPGNALDAEFDRTNQAVDAIIGFLAATFTAGGSLLPGVITTQNLSPNLAAQLQQIETAASIVDANNSLAFAEYLAGPVVSGAAADNLVAQSPFPGNIFDAPTSMSPAGGLYSAKFWALQAAAAAKIAGAVNALAITFPFAPDGSTVVYAMRDSANGGTILPDNAAELLLYVNGFAQAPGVDFAFVAPASVTFAVPPPPGAKVFGFFFRPNATH